MQGAEERRVKRISNTPQGGASEGNTADGVLIVDQGVDFSFILRGYYVIIKNVRALWMETKIQKGGIAMSLKNAKQPLIFLGMILCLGWLVTGCATSQQLAEIQDQANLALETAERAMAESQAAKADCAEANSTAVSAAEDAEAAAIRAERAATKAEAMADKTENIFMKKMKK
jgi:hypothetical protein